MPYAFNRDDLAPTLAGSGEITQFDLTYRWHYQLAKTLSQELTIDVQRLMYFTLYAALCGSFAKDAKYTGLRLNQPNISLTFFPGRFVDDRLPSRRLTDLLAWTGNYIERGGKIPDSWEKAWELVNRAHQDLWGTTVVEEIGADIASDERFLAMARTGDRPMHPRLIRLTRSQT